MQIHCSTISTLGKTTFSSRNHFSLVPISLNNKQSLTYANFRRIATAVVYKEANFANVVKNITLSFSSMC